jgi:hypothetical protein
VVKKVFVCWECCKIIPEEEGHKILDGFWGNRPVDKNDPYFTND